MRSARVAISLVLLAMLGVFLTARSRAARQPQPEPQECFYPSLIAAYHGLETSTGLPQPVDQGGGIREDIPKKYATRYEAWKREFLLSEAGKNKWAADENNPTFLLRIEVSHDNAEGATTGKYEWNMAGRLIAATITLGNRLD